MNINDKIAKYIIKHPKLSNPQIALKLGVSRTKVWQIRKLTESVKFTTKKANLGKAITMNGFEGLQQVEDPETKQKRIRIIHAGGPPTGVKLNTSSYQYSDIKPYDPDIVNHWEPHMNLTVHDSKTGSPLSAASINYMRNTKKKWVPTIYANPLQSLDYITIEAHTRSTIGGPLMRAMIKFIVGNGFRPELELINPGEDSAENQKEIDGHEDVIHDLVSIEDQISFDEDGYLDIPYQDKIAMMLLNAFTFNRSALDFSFDKTVKIDDRLIGGLPSSAKYQHARSIGMIQTDPYTARLKAVQFQDSSGFTPIDEVAYFWNPIVGANTYNALHYGDSLTLPMIDALRVIRKNIGVNFNSMAENAYSGLGLLFVKPQGSTEEQKQDEYAQVSRNIVPATTNILMEDPAYTRFDNVDYKPEFDGLINTNESLVKYCAACLGMPHAMFYDESASNRATMIGKINLAVSTVIEPYRNIISRYLSPQTYDKWFRIIYKKDTELLKKFRVKMTFDNLNIAEWYDKVEAANEIDSRKQLTDKSYGELLGILDYTNKVESDAETIPGGAGGGGKKMNFGSGDNSFQIKDTSKMKN